MPGALADVPYEEVSFPAEQDGTVLRGWLIPAPGSDRLIISVHGIENNRSGGRQAVFAPLLRDLNRDGFNVLAFDLRGHGASDGRWMTLGFVEQRDVLGALAFARTRGFAPEHTGILAWSMGGASTLGAMAKVQAQAFVIDSSFATMTALIDEKLPWPLRWGVIASARLFWGVNAHRVRPIDGMTALGDRHIFLIHGADDTLIPPSMLEELAQAGGANVERAWLVPHAQHTAAYVIDPDAYRSAVSEFFTRELGR